MNLAYPLENTTEINGVTYEVNWSFDNILRLLDLVKDNELQDVEKVTIGLEMLIGDPLDSYELKERADIFVQLFKSIVNDGKEGTHERVDLEGNPMPTTSEATEKTYDIAQDATYIYASFMHTYHMDLYEEQGKLDWRKFKSLLNGLDKDSIFNRVIEIRTADYPKGKGSEKDREKLRKAKKQVALKEDDENE